MIIANQKMLKNQAEALLKIDSVYYHKKEHKILEDISITIARGEITTLLGPNGAGKSTLIKLAINEIQPSSGTVFRANPLQIGYVPQNINTNASLPISVRRFMSLGKKTITAKQIDRMLELVGVPHTANSSFHHISGGEMRRVLLARALLYHPDLLILDEPTAGVDVKGQSELFALIKMVKEKYNCGVLLVSHDLHVVMASTDNVICINQRVCCKGSPHEMEHDIKFKTLFNQFSRDHFAIYKHNHHHDSDKPTTAP